MRPSLGAPRKKWMENRWRRRGGGGGGTAQVKTGVEREELMLAMITKQWH